MNDRNNHAAEKLFIETYIKYIKNTDIIEAKDLIDKFDFGQYYIYRQPYGEKSLYKLCVSYNNINMMKLLIEKNYHIHEFYKELSYLCRYTITWRANKGYDMLEFLLEYIENEQTIRSLLRYAVNYYESRKQQNDCIIELLEAHVL